MTSTLLVVATAGVLAVPLARRLIARRFDPFEPVVIFAMAWGTMFVVRPAAMLLGGQLEYVRPTRSVPIASTFPEALLLGLIGAAAFLGAYGSSWGQRVARRAPVPPRQYDTGALVIGAALAAGLGIAGFLYFLVTVAKLGGMSGLALFFSGRSVALMQAAKTMPAYVGHLGYLLAPAALILYAMGRARRSRPLLAGALLCIAAAVIRALPGGSRMSLLPLVGGLVVYHYTTARRRPRLASLAALAAAAIVASVIIVSVRDSGVRQTLGVGGAIAERFSDPTSFFAPFTEGGDTEMVAALAAALRFVPEVIPYAYGKAVIGDLVTRPIPRHLWPGKPRPPREALILSLWPEEVDAFGVPLANPEFSVLLHFYLDLGIIGVVLGMMLYGVVARGLYEYYRLHASSSLARLVFALSLPFVVIGLRDSPVDLIDRASFALLPLLLAFWFAAAPRLRYTVPARARGPLPGGAAR